MPSAALAAHRPAQPIARGPATAGHYRRLTGSVSSNIVSRQCAKSVYLLFACRCPAASGKPH
eukprot:2996764-Prymnesium_polylepis.1